jgi:predicted  nucleic acid-binding Zn-ribbon protein
MRARIQAGSRGLMNSELQNLLELQQVDARIAAVRAEVAALPKEVARIESKLAGSKAAVEAAQAAMKADETARRKHESDIKDQQEKISKYRDQSLKVKTNQEYKALLTEIEHAEGEIRKLEDKILEIMVAADARKEGLKQAEATLKADTAANEKEKEHARQQTAEDEKQLDELNTQRKQLRAGVGEETLTHYDRVLKLRGSVMAAVYEDESCSGCRVRLRPQVFQDVMSNDQIVTCFYCNRILYYVPPPPKPEDEAKAAKAEAAAKSAEEEEPVQTDEAAG